MNIILNLTQHAATAEQIAAGVVDLCPDDRAIVCRWLTFDTCPVAQEIADRADLVAQAAAGDSKSVTVPAGVTFAMIGGAPFFISALENALIEVGITPLYAFSVRESAEQVQPDGSVRKVNVFKHAGFVQI